MSTTEHYGPAARLFLMKICDQMLHWLLGLQRNSNIKDWHYEQDSSPAGKGISQSILMDLWPAPDQNQYMSASLALDAIRAFKGLVARYGALHGSFQIWDGGSFRGISRISIVEWPLAQAVEEQWYST